MERKKPKRPEGRKRVPALPVEAILDHPKLANASAAVYGCIMRLVMHYWSNECEELPTGANELKAIGRFPEFLWRSDGAMLLQVLEDIRPHLDYAHAVRVMRLQNMQDLGIRGNAIKKLRIAQQGKGEVVRRMGQGDVSIPRKQPKRTDIPPPIVTSPTPHKRRTG